MENEITKYVEYLFALALKKCGDVNDAEDLTQETLLAAFQYVKRGGTISHMKYWLTSVLSNKWNEALRRKYRLPLVSVDVREYIIFCNRGFSNFFFENLHRNLALFGFKLLKTLLGGCGEDSRLNGVDEIVNAFFYFIKLFAKNRKCAAFGIELGNQHICKSVEKFIVKDELLNEQDYNFFDPFLLDGFLLTRSTLARATAFVIAVNFHRMTCSALSRDQTLTIAAEQLCGQQILVLGFVLGWSFLVCGGSLLYLFK